MQYNNDDNNNGYSGFGYNPDMPTGSAPNVPPMPEPINNHPQAVPGGVSEVPHYIQTDIHEPTAAATGEANAPPVSANNNAPVWRPFPSRTGEMTGERVFVPYAEDWREPSYSPTHETTSDMYTPGIYTNQQHYKKRDAEANPDIPKRTRSGRAGRILRAVCLVIVCAALSGAASYGVVEYRLQRGDFDITMTNQVVIGGENSGNQQFGIVAPVARTGSELAAEIIYDMALSQVVGVETEAPAYGGIFGAQGSVTGSGFIISSDGYILTNYHVIQTARENNLPLKVYLHDESVYDADIIGYDEYSDVALIKIDAVGLNPVVIGNSDNNRVGQIVYAVGNPFGDLVYTMTSGIVSALDRVVTVEDKRISAFQFDAAVNSGNSGGPVYDANGDVIGIVSMKLMGNSVEGIGFAIPINDAILIASELIEHGYISGRPYIGITVQTVTSGHADFYGWVVGAYVRSVAPESAGEKSGLAVGDIIIELGDIEIDSRDGLLFALRRFSAGDTTTMTVWRNGEEVKLSITFDENLTAGQPQNS